jgi:hypothetical protein
MTESVDTKPSILQPFYDHARLMEQRVVQPERVSLEKPVPPPVRPSLWGLLRLIGGRR